MNLHLVEQPSPDELLNGVRAAGDRDTLIARSCPAALQGWAPTDPLRRRTFAGHHHRPGTLERFVHDLRVSVLLAALEAVALTPARQVEDPLMEAFAAVAQGGL